jgi:hypothetical protein
MTHGQLWPAHPKPLPDELLSSWFVRAAQANGIKLQTLTRMLFGPDRSPWHYDIDRQPPEWLLESVYAHTGLPPGDAQYATLETYRGRLFAQPRISGTERWVLPIGSMGATRRGFGMQMCPACLASDATPFYRKPWRLALFTFCPNHDCMLYDACPACGAPIAYFRHDFGREISKDKGMAYCWRCEFDFRRAKRPPPFFPTDEIQTLFFAMLSSLKASAANIDRFDKGFFSVLHQLCRVMGMRQNQGRFLTYISNQLTMEPPSIHAGRMAIEEHRVNMRHSLLVCGLWVMASLNERLQLAWANKAVRYNHLVRDFHAPPTWYLSVVDSFLQYHS